MNVTWSREARDDLLAIVEHVLSHDPMAAGALMQQIDEAVGDLADFPRMGRPGRVAGTRERIVGGTAYVVAYRIRDDRVEVLRVLHGARKWPQRL